MQLFDALMEWAEKSCERKSLNTNNMQNMRNKFNKLHLFRFEQMEYKEFATRFGNYIGFFTQSELADIMDIIALRKQFKSNIFTKNPRADWNHNLIFDDSNILGCTIPALMQYGNDVEYFNFSFSINKKILLGKIRTTLAGKFLPNLTIQLIRSDEELIPFIIHRRHIDFRRGMFKFSQPILIDPKYEYRFKFQFSFRFNFRIYCRKTEQTQITLDDDIKVDICAGDDIIDKLYFNKMK